MRMLQLIVLMVPAIIAGLLASDVWHLSPGTTILVGFPPAMALIIWAMIVSE